MTLSLAPAEALKPNPPLKYKNSSINKSEREGSSGEFIHLVTVLRPPFLRNLFPSDSSALLLPVKLSALQMQHALL